MVATESYMSPIGTKATNFDLYSPSKKTKISFSSSTKGKGFLIAFICNHCPYVVHLKDNFPTLFNSFLTKDIGF